MEESSTSFVQSKKINMDQDIHKIVKINSAKEGKSIKDYVKDAVLEYIEKESNSN